MFVDERLEKILKIIEEKGRVDVFEIRDIIGVSADTIRRDFDKLSKRGLVMRTHGGLVSKNNILFDTYSKERKESHEKEKESIAKKASTFINNAETIILDAGSTTEKILDYLNDKKNLTIC